MKIRNSFSRAALAAVTVSLVIPVVALAQPASPRPEVPDELDLKSAIGLALENNFAIRQARERIKEQEGVVVQVTAREIPNVSAGGTYQVNDKSVSSTVPQSHTGWSLNVTATQTLFAGGGVRSAVRSAKLTREAALLDLKSVVNDALLQVRTAFFNVILAREKITVQERNLELLQQQLKTTTDRFEAGTVSSFEKLRAEVAVANARTPLITARNDYRLSVETLRQAIGLTTGKPGSALKVPEVKGSLAYTPVTFDLESAFSTAHANRPDLQRLDKLTKAQEESLTNARSNYYPTVAAFGGWQLRKGYTESFNDSNDGWLAGVQANWNVFDGRATRGRVIQARSALEQTKLSLTEAELATEVEVRQAFSSWQEATELADASKKVVEQADEAVRLANARYNAGTGTQLDVLQAQVDLTTARTNQLQAYYTYNVAVANLRRAMGQADELIVQ